MDRTTALLKASIKYERQKREGLGHGFKTDERTYQDFAERMGDMALEIEVKDQFSEAMFKKLNAMRLEFEDMAARLKEQYEDRD